MEITFALNANILIQLDILFCIIISQVKDFGFKGETHPKKNRGIILMKLLETNQPSPPSLGNERGIT